MRIIAVVEEGVRLVRRYERVRFSPILMVLSVCRFAPHPILPRLLPPPPPPANEQSVWDGGGVSGEERRGEESDDIALPKPLCNSSLLFSSLRSSCLTWHEGQLLFPCHAFAFHPPSSRSRGARNLRVNLLRNRGRRRQPNHW